MQSELPALLLSIAVISVFVLIAGGIRLLRTGDRSKGILMLVAAAVLLGNVLIWGWTPAR
jgi:hypothetical protein